MFAHQPDEKKQKQMQKERMETDAYAMAYLLCDFNMDIERAKANPNNKTLRLKAKEAQKIYIVFDTTMRKRYKDDFDRFKDIIEDSKKNFKVCKDLNDFIEQNKKKREIEAAQKGKK